MDTENIEGSEKEHLPSYYAQRLAAGVELPEWAAGRFSSDELTVLGVIRDAAYNAQDGACSLTVKEIAQLAQVSSRVASRTITVGIAVGVISREERSFLNHHIHYKVR